MRVPIRSSGVIAFALALASCSSDQPDYYQAPTGPSAPAGATASVTAQAGGGVYGEGGFSFSPSGVAVIAGGTVTWSNGTGVDHNVTFSGVSNALANGGQYVRSFPNIGTFGYNCTIHSEMTGSVQVVSP
ncbi:MAG: hypothetical protein WD771_00625 [Gemmatimonadaceae bacterium]